MKLTPSEIVEWATADDVDLSAITEQEEADSARQAISKERRSLIAVAVRDKLVKRRDEARLELGRLAQEQALLNEESKKIDGLVDSLDGKKAQPVASRGRTLVVGSPEELLTGVGDYVTSTLIQGYALSTGRSERAAVMLYGNVLERDRHRNPPIASLKRESGDKPFQEFFYMPALAEAYTLPRGPGFLHAGGEKGKELVANFIEDYYANNPEAYDRLGSPSE